MVATERPFLTANYSTTFGITLALSTRAGVRMSPRIDAPKFADRNAEDFILLRCENWTDQLRRHYERANEGLNFFTSDALIQRQVTVTEFPKAD
jgi:hypothetical protein